MIGPWGFGAKAGTDRHSEHPLRPRQGNLDCTTTPSFQHYAWRCPFMKIGGPGTDITCGSQRYREIGDLLPTNQRQGCTCFALCHILCPVSAAHTSISRMDSNFTCYPQRYSGNFLTEKRTLLGPYRRPIPRVLGGSKGGGRFLMVEVPLYGFASGLVDE